MTPALEMPGAMRSRLLGGTRAAVGKRILAPHAPITKRINQPSIPTKELAGHIGHLRPWIHAWREAAAKTTGMDLATTTKSSAGIRLALPSSITFDGLESYAAWMGVEKDLRLARARILDMAGIDTRLEGMAQVWPETAALNTHEFIAFCALVRWRRDNPDIKPPVRALAINGIDSKWIERNKGFVATAFRLIDAFDPQAPTLLEQMGFDTQDRMTVWFRCGAEVGGIARMAPQFALRPSETNPTQFTGARRAIVIENQTSFETLALAPHDIAIFGQGAQAPAALGLMPWLSQSLDTLLYWGDMDAEGYHILSRARQACPQLQSILMGDKETEGHLAGLSHKVAPDGRPTPHNLSPHEARAYMRLAPEGLRIEQEWLPHADIAQALA